MPSKSYALVLCDETGTISNAQLNDAAYDLAWQADNDIAPEYGPTATVRVGKGDASDVKPEEIACIVKQTLPEAPQTVGYHATTANGAPIAFFALSYCSSIANGNGSLVQCFSHEMGETIGDPGANQWALKSDGQTLQAKEACDRVQDRWYAGPKGGGLSDFLLLSAFDPGSSGPWDKLGALTGGEARTPGGYEIDAVLQSETQVSGEAVTAAYANGTYRRRYAERPGQAIIIHGDENLTAKHRHWSSRILRRVARYTLNDMPRSIKP